MGREKGTGSLQREKSGRWTVRFGINGKRLSRSTGTTDRGEAERFLERMLAPFGLGARRVPLNDVWRQYLVSPKRRDLAPATLDSKRNVWFGFARWVELHYPAVTQLAQLSQDLVAEYLAELRTDHCASTYNGRVCVLREIFRTLADKAGVFEDPWQGVRLLADDSLSRRELSVEEVRRLIAACDGQGEWRKLFLVGLYTGLRLGDCCKLRWQEVDLARGVIQLIPSKTRKHAHGHPVTIPVHPVLAAALGDCPRPGGTDYVLPEIAALYLQARWRVSERIACIFKSAGITMRVRVEGRRRLVTEASFHSLRHTFVSLAANAGVPLAVVQAIVGHSSTVMTRHYYHDSEEALRRAIAALPATDIAAGG